MRRAMEVVKEGITALVSIGCGGVQRAIQLPVAEYRAHVSARLLEGNQLEELIGVVGARAREPPRDRRDAGVVRRHGDLGAAGEAAQQLREVCRAEVQVQI